MSKVKIQGNASGSGVFTLTSPNSATDRTITLPDASGTLAFTTDDDDKLPLAGGTMTGDLVLGDNVRLEVGSLADGDMVIYHDGSNSYIDERGTGQLNIRSNRVDIKKYTGETMAQFVADDGCALFFNNVAKISTTSAGATIAGIATATSFAGSGANLTGIVSSFSGLTDTTVSTSDPAVNSNPSASGHIWVNKTSGEAYVCIDATSNSNVWINTGEGSGSIGNVTTATGGTVTTSGDYKIHTFTSSGNFVVSANYYPVEYLVIGGGGGGGGAIGAGGGAGGYSTATGFAVSNQTYAVTVGAGGIGGVSSSAMPTNGANSVFSSITSGGGGYGGPNVGGYLNGANGSNNSSGGGGATGKIGGSGQGTGRNGGNGSSNTGVNSTSGGGGGAGGYGIGGGQGNPGNGGPGLASSITGSSVVRAGGGGGGRHVNGSNSTGGTGGGGNGGSSSGNATSAGATNTGSGGGGAGVSHNGTAGGSGIVIIKYRFQ